MTQRSEPSDQHAAASLLTELDHIERRTKAATRLPATGLPLVTWGLAWAIGYSAVAVLPAVPGLLVLAVATGVGIAISWIGRPAVRTGWEHKLRLGWASILGSSFFLINTIAPLPHEKVLLFLGGLWGLGMLLYAIAASDRGLGFVAGTSIVIAGVAPILPGPALITYGVLAGGLLVGLGTVRCRQGRSANLAPSASIGS